MTKKNLPAPKMDVVFQSLFKKGNENITMALISDIIGRKIKTKVYLENILKINWEFWI